MPKPKKNKKNESVDIQRFKKFVTKILGKDDAKVFFAENNAIWEEKIEKDEPELENFVLRAIEFDNATCAVILMNDWMKRMNCPEKYEEWTKNTSQIKKRILEEAYFQIKADVFRANMKKFGGRKGIVDRLLEANRVQEKKDYEKASKLAKPLLNVLDYNPFVTNDVYQYVSIIDKMEDLIYRYHKSRTYTRNINSVCPVEHILLRNGSIAFEMQNFSEAERFLIEALKWNPASVYGLWILSNVYLEQKKWKKYLSTIIKGLECAYRPSHFVIFYDALISYFYCKNLYKDALCCNYLKMQYVSSDRQRRNIGRDFQFISRSDDWIKKSYKKLCDIYIGPLDGSLDKQGKNANCKTKKRINITTDDIYESSKKYGYPISVNPNVITIAKKSCEVAVRVKNKEDVDYFTFILSDLEKCRLNTDKLILKMSRHKYLKAVN